jgi:hypothetical protein
MSSWLLLPPKSIQSKSSKPVESIQEADAVALKPLAADLALADLDNFGSLSTATTGKTNRVSEVPIPNAGGLSLAQRNIDIKKFLYVTESLSKIES